MKVNITYREDEVEDKTEPWRKVSVQLNERDTWNADTTLASIIVPVLEQLRDTTHGYPGEFMNDGNIPEDYDNKYGDYDDDKGMERWKDAINKMIWSFNQSIDGYKDEVFNIEKDVNTWKIYYKEYEKRIQEGYDLFAKYYRGLWD